MCANIRARVCTYARALIHARTTYDARRTRISVAAAVRARLRRIASGGSTVLRAVNQGFRWYVRLGETIARYSFIRARDSSFFPFDAPRSSTFIPFASLSSLLLFLVLPTSPLFFCLSFFCFFSSFFFVFLSFVFFSSFFHRLSFFLSSRPLRAYRRAFFVTAVVHARSQQDAPRDFQTPN